LKQTKQETARQEFSWRVADIKHLPEDCKKDLEVLIAFNVGITKGTSATPFSPNDLLNR